MEISSLVRARALRALAPNLLPALATTLIVAAGCHDGAAGGRSSDAAVDQASDLVVKLPPPDANCSADAPGGGACPINFCGTPKSIAALGAGESATLGADAICTPGYSCVPDGATADGKSLQLRCVEPLRTAGDFGAACATGAAATDRCKNDALCIQAAAAPGQPFCSALCRADGDCPKDAYCLEHQSAPLPNGSYVVLGYCTPKAKIAGTACAREADCPADEGCVSAGARTNLLTCQKVGGTKSMGERCTKATECRSGQCFDREFHAESNLSYCSGPCGRSSDCGADQRCARVVLGNNGTPADPFDDLVAGLCQTLFVPVAATGCTKDADCMAQATGGSTCSTKYGLCYTPGAASGAACASDQQCTLGAVCTMNARFPGGYCQTLGCAPGATAGSVDSCPGAHAACVQRGSDAPLYACYEGCAQSGDCSRFQQNYVCEPPESSAGTGGGDASAPDADGGTDAATAPASICIYSQGA